MICSPIDVRYAQAFYRMLSAKKKLESTIVEIQLLSDFFSQTPTRVFFHKNEKMQKNLSDFLEQSVKKHVGKEINDFFRFLSTKHRLNRLPNILKAFLKHHRHCLGQIEARLVLAYPVDEAFLEEIRTKIEQKKNKKCHLLVEIDKKLVGGFCIYFDDVVWDYSLLGQLQNLEKVLI